MQPHSKVHSLKHQPIQIQLFSLSYAFQIIQINAILKTRFSETILIDAAYIFVRIIIKICICFFKSIKIVSILFTIFLTHFCTFFVAGYIFIAKCHFFFKKKRALDIIIMMTKNGEDEDNDDDGDEWIYSLCAVSAWRCRV